MTDIVVPTLGESVSEATVAKWLKKPGDVVRADDDGNLYFVDRKKNVIRRSGENISALEVESVLRSHAQVQEVAVAATPDEVRGDEVLACVIAREAMSAERQREAAADLVRHCLRQLAYHKAPGWVAFVDELPLTASQKLQRGELKKLAMTLPGQQGVIDTRPMKRRPR